ncbi:hypothetical protein GGR55DRAFT_533326 [Xylaria sp. FL0064]|nr:hypothetical protein GGR55DRAFT_533326 [Xylaria sp. FL0064]
MASPSTPAGMALLVEERHRLIEELAQLGIFKSWAEHNLLEMGLDLHVARTQGWVSKRAEVRRKRAARKRAAKKQAAKDEKWAELLRNRQWIRDQRKKVGLPVNDEPTPSPTEAAYKEQHVAEAATKATAQTLRDRVRRASHQLLIAAAIGKQHRKVTGTDRSSHNAPSADVDAHSEKGLTTSAAIARAFRNWVNQEKAYRARFRSPSSSPSIIALGDQTAGPEAIPNKNRGGSSLAGDDAGVASAMALIYDDKFWDENDIGDSEDEDDVCGLASLSFNDVSDEIKLTVYAMLAAVENNQDGRQDWADLLATKVLKYLSPSSTMSSVEKGPRFGSDGLLGDSSHNQKTGPRYWKTMSTVPEWLGNTPGKKRASRSPNSGLDKSKSTMKFHNRQAQHLPNRVSLEATPRPYGTKKRSDMKDTTTPNLWDLEYWKVGEDDGKKWSAKPASWTQPTDDMETGFVTWEEQERRFPRLDDYLRMREVGSSRSKQPTIYNPETVDTEVWDPFNRAIAEARTGKREPLHLNAITMLSLDRWMAAGLGIDFPRVPIPQPPNPPVEAKKRPLRAEAFSAPSHGVKREEGKKKMPGKGENLSGGSLKLKGIPRKKVAFSIANSSPAAQSLSKSHRAGKHNTEEHYQKEQFVFAGPRYLSRVGKKVNSPPTPYPFAASLYEVEETLDEGAIDEEELAAYREFLRSGGSTEVGSGKRAATEDDATSGSASKKRKTEDGGGGPAAKKNGASKSGNALEPGIQSPEQQQGVQPVPSLSPLPATPSNKYGGGKRKKSVHFDLHPYEGAPSSWDVDSWEDGPSVGMLDNARRALKRYSRTASSAGLFR